MPDDASPSTLPAVGTEWDRNDARKRDTNADLGNHATTGLPLAKGMSLSLWLQTVRCDKLLDHRSTEAVPSSAEVVIVGSGLTGTLAALTLLESPNPPKSVVLLEAREFCSGATGRNAGHCKPDSWRGFSKYKDLVGAEQALKILRNESDTFEALRSYVLQNSVQCEFWDGKTIDVLMTEDLAEAAAKNMKDFLAAGGSAAGIETLSDPVEAERVSRLKGAKSAYVWEAATLHPWKLASHICRRALKLGLNLQTWTPVTNITGTANDWTLKTERGEIHTSTIVHATNAYVGTLLPETIGIIHPTPHVCNKVIPSSNWSGTQSLSHSYCVVHPNGAYHSINPRQNADGAILFGGAATNHQALLDWMAQDPKRCVDDSLVDFKPSMDAVQRDFGHKGFEWDHDADARGGQVRYDYSWSGITARSRDRVPFVGKVPWKPGQWICAGHNGHGMARIFTLAPALAKMVQGAAWKDTGIPECFQITQERLDTLRKETS